MSRIQQLILNKWIRVKVWIFNNWKAFNYFNLIWSISFIPVTFFLSFYNGYVLFAVIPIWMLLFLGFNGVKYDIAKRKKLLFLEVEDMNRTLSTVLWKIIYPVALILCLVYFLLLININVAEVVGPVFVPIFVIFGCSCMGLMLYQTTIIGNDKLQPRLLRVRASVYFTVTASLINNPSSLRQNRVFNFTKRLFQNPKPAEVEKRKKLVKLFGNGMNDLNNYLVYYYDAELADLRKCIDYFHYVVSLEKSLESERLRKVVDVLGYTLSVKAELTDIVWTTKQLLQEKPFITHEEMFEVFDFKTGINRWYKHNKEAVQLTLLLISVLSGIVALLQAFL